MYYLLCNIIKRREKQIIFSSGEQKYMECLSFLFEVLSFSLSNCSFFPSPPPSLVIYALILYLWGGKKRKKRKKKVSFPVPSTFCCCWHASAQISSLSAVLKAQNAMRPKVPGVRCEGWDTLRDPLRAMGVGHMRSVHVSCDAGGLRQTVQERNTGMVSSQAAPWVRSAWRYFLLDDGR